MGKKKWRRLKNSLIHCKFCHADFTDEDVTIRKAIEECSCKKLGIKCGLETFFSNREDKKIKLKKEIQQELHKREEDGKLEYHLSETSEKEEEILPILYFFIPDSKNKMRLHMKIK